MESNERTKEEMRIEIEQLRARNAELEAQLKDVDEVLQRFIGRPADRSMLPEQLRQQQVRVEALAREEREFARAAIAQKVEELARAHAQLMQLDAMKLNFLGLISHELRTPISVIVGYASILEDEAGNMAPAEQSDFLRKIMVEADKLLALVNSILDMNRLMMGQMTLDQREVAFPEIARNVVDQLRPAAVHKALRLEVEVPESLPLLVSDEQRLGQILRNLLDNAIKFTPPHGTVWVRAREADDHLHCEVQDTGIGIEQADVDRLFKVFGQLDSSATRLRGGMGLGLAIARELVTLMGGSIGARSTPGEGSTFWFTVPLCAPGNRPPALDAIEIRRQAERADMVERPR